MAAKTNTKGQQPLGESMNKKPLHRQLQGVVFDVDGTLLRSNNTLSPRMAEVCQAAVKNGIHLMIASARPSFSVQAIAKKIGAKGTLCALNGAIIMTADGDIKQKTSLPKDAADALIKRFKADSQVSLNIYSGADWIVSSFDKRIREEAEIIGFMPELQRNLSAIQSVEKILLIAEDDYAALLTKNLQNEDSRLSVVLSKSGYVEITSCSVDKMQGVREACCLMGLSLKNFVSCGDGENDITLLNSSGYGIAMAHAPEELKQVASQIVGSNNDDSLAEAIHTIFLSS